MFSADGPPSALRGPLLEVRRIATSVRDRLSLDTWRILGQLGADATLGRRRVQMDEVLRHLDRLVTDLAAFSGMEMENMTRGYTWRFLDTGRRLERALQTIRLIRTALEDVRPVEPVLGSLLEIADSSMTYRRRYFAEPQIAPVLDLLLGEATNPRAVAFQLRATLDHLEALPKDESWLVLQEERSGFAEMAARAEATDFDALGQTTQEAGYADLFALLDGIGERLYSLSDALAATYFSHAQLRVSE